MRLIAQPPPAIAQVSNMELSRYPKSPGSLIGESAQGKNFREYRTRTVERSSSGASRCFTDLTNGRSERERDSDFAGEGFPQGVRASGGRRRRGGVGG